ncbi:hypothetical protein, partial [Methanosarcina sp.]|uniref:hypothetical protein n=1 Tax=Methanosarcina sp. TaxID=2213 RepID=UPI003BB4A5DC
SRSESYSYLTPTERRGWAWGLANSSSKDEPRSPFLKNHQILGGVVHTCMFLTSRALDFIPFFF